MSFILDALKKSESDRQGNSRPGFTDIPAGSAQPRAPRWVWLVSGLLGINAIVIAALWLGGRADSPARPPDAGARTAATGSATPPFAEIVSDARRKRPGAPTSEAPQAALTRSPVTQAAFSDEPAPPPAARREIPAARELRAPDPVALETFNELRANGSLQLPDLHLDIHVYAKNPAERFVFVNMSKYREKATLEEGPTIREINADGVVLEYDGTNFLLPRE